MTARPDDPVSPSDARALAAGVLERVERDRAYADVTLQVALERSPLPTRDRALATRLVYGTLAWQGRLDWHLATLATRNLDALDMPVRIALRLGLYQVLFLDRVPPHAAVDTSVEIVKRRVPAAAGLVNAILRRALRERHALALPDSDLDRTRHLAIRWSHPEWLVERWRKRFDDEELATLLAADNEPAPTVLRAPVGRREALIAELRSQGVDAQPGRFAPAAIRVADADPRALADRAAGAFTVQSEASQLVGHLLSPAPGMRVLDACAAPGGKATHALELMLDTGWVVALERRRAGAAAVGARARRLGRTRVVTIAADARNAAALLRDVRFDRILVDAPCTGFGTLRSHPEIRWTRSAADVTRLATLQREILEGVTPLLREGGALVYATCTIMREENEDVVAGWLSAHPELARERAETFLPPAAAALVDAEGALRTLPHRDDLDGFHAVRVRRRG